MESLSFADLVLVALIALAVTLAVRSMRRKRCSCGCADCAYTGTCEKNGHLR